MVNGFGHRNRIENTKVSVLHDSDSVVGAEPDGTVNPDNIINAGKRCHVNLAVIPLYNGHDIHVINL